MGATNSKPLQLRQPWPIILSVICVLFFTLIVKVPHVTAQGVGSITIVKDAQPDSTQAFKFVTTGSSLSNFELTDDGSPTNTVTFSGLADGDYSFTEDLIANWTLTDIQCKGTGVTTDLGNRTVSIVLSGQDVICTFVNAPSTGKLTVIKHVIGGAKSASDFTFHVKSGGVDVAGSPKAGSETGIDYTLPVGNYVVSENSVASGYAQVGFQGDCDSAGSVTVDATTAKTCTIVNAATGIAVKVTPNNSVVSPGTAVTYAYEVSNPATVPLNSVSVSDNKCAPVNPVLSGGFNVGDVKPNNALDAGEIWQFSCTTTITVDTINTATANGTPTGGATVSAQAQASVHVLGSLKVTNTPTPTSVPPAGAIVTYTLQVQNTSASGNVTLNTAQDSRYGNVADAGNAALHATTCAMPQTVLPTAQYTCIFSTFISGTLGSQVVSTVTVNGTDSGNQAISGSATATVQIASALLQATKSYKLLTDSDHNGVASPGDTLEYTLVITNKGNLSARSVVVNDTPDANSALVVGSVKTTVGKVQVGNKSGETQVIVNVGSLSANKLATIQFRVTINAVIPIGVTTLANQATITSQTLPPLLSDDPTTVALADPTITILVASPSLTATKTVTLAEDLNGDKAVSPGDLLAYTVKIANRGNQAATLVNVSDTLDANTTLVMGSVTTTRGTLVKGNQSGDTQVQVDIGTIQGNNDNATITFQVKINNPLSAGVNQVSNQGMVTAANQSTIFTDDPTTTSVDDPTVIAVQATPKLIALKRDQLLVDADHNGYASPGDTLAYSITLANQGNQAVASVSLQDSPDANTTLVAGSVVTDRGVVKKGNGAKDNNVEVTIGTLNGANDSVNLAFHVLVKPNLTANVVQVTNQGTLRSSSQPSLLTDDPDTLTLDDATVTPLNDAPHILATKRIQLAIDADQSGTPSPSDTVTYTLVVTNQGTQPATNVLVSDPLDSNLLLVIGSVQTTQGTVVKGALNGDNAVQITLPSLAPAGTLVITFRAQIKDPLPSGVTHVSNQGIISGANFPTLVTDDPTTAAANDATDLAVSIVAGLDATKRVQLAIDANADGVPSPGDTLHYQIQLANKGNTQLNAVALVDKLDVNTTLVVGSVNTTQGLVTRGNQAGDHEVNVQVGTLASQSALATIEYDAQINQNLASNVTIIQNQGVVTSNELPPVNTDDPTTPAVDDPTQTSLQAFPRLTASKQVVLLVDQDQDGVAEPGDTLSYVITVANLGNRNATGIRLTDPIDPNTSLLPGSVQSSQGVIQSGNNAGDTQVQVALDTLSATNGQATISFQVTINSPLPTTTVEISNQAHVQSNELPEVLSDDPSTSQNNDPTRIQVRAAPRLQLSKEDLLWIDADDDRQVTFGDFLLYQFKVVNSGNSAATGILLRDIVDPRTVLETGSVQSSQGNVQQGNASNDPGVTVDIGTLPAHSSGVIGFRVRLNADENGTLSNQATLTYDNPPGNTGTAGDRVDLVSDDPATAAVQDPTLTPIARSANPIHGGPGTPLIFLPMIKR